jgi:lysozyme
MNRSMRRCPCLGFFASAVLIVSACEAIEPVPDKGVGTSWFAMTEICPAGETVEGIDVSVYQATIDWDTVAGAGIEFVIVRASVADAKDDTFDFNWPEARRVGLIRGAYHYFYPNVDAAAQAEVFLSAIGTLEADDLPPALDVEEQGAAPSPDVYAAAVREWLDLVEAATGRMPVIYAGPYFWESTIQAADMADHPMWVAHWGVTCPLVPDPWTSWVFHQYDVGDYGTVPGISTRIDRDVFNGDLAALLDFANVTPECGDGLCNGGETHETCPGDCPVCEPIPPEGRIVDETEICFEKGGPPQYWRTEAAGWNGSLFWTPRGTSSSSRPGGTGSRPTRRHPGPSRARPATS